MAHLRFSDIKTNAARGQQIYQILVGLAHGRQTLTYGILADKLGFSGAGVFAAMLGHIMYWCEREGLPPLTILIVNQTTGLPGDGLVTTTDLHAEREAVFQYDWFDIVPPSAAELAEAYAAATA